MVHTYLVHNTYPTLKPRLVEHTHNFLGGDVAIRNSLRSNKQYEVLVLYNTYQVRVGSGPAGLRLGSLFCLFVRVL